MKRLFCLIALGASLCWVAAAQNQQRPTPLKLVQTIELPGVTGRIDHMAMDVKGKRLFVAALGNKTVEVIDLAAGKVIHTINGLKEPQGIFYTPESNLLFVADGQLDTCRIYKGSTYELVRSETALQDADNIRYDTAHAAIYGTPLVEVGYGSGTASGLRALDSLDGKPLMEIPLGGHPEAFEVAGRRIFVNVPTAGYIAVADTGRRRVMDKWPVQGFKDFFPMAVDETNQRLFIGSRTPPALLVFDTKSGKMLTSVEAVGDTDDLTYDTAHKRLYMTGGDGMIAIFEQRDADHYALVTKMPSSPGARTSLFVPELNRFYIAAPSNAGKPAKVLVYEAQPNT
jgi:YVTN family beta-propeller protein